MYIAMFSIYLKLLYFFEAEASPKQSDPEPLHESRGRLGVLTRVRVWARGPLAAAELAVHQGQMEDGSPRLLIMKATARLGSLRWSALWGNCSTTS